MTLCILNIGNTQVRMDFDGKETRIPTTEFVPEMIPAGVPCAASSVVPALTEKLRSARPDIFWITRDTPGIPDLSRVEAEKLGADRIANASKLLLDGILPAMTIDCGTAVNCEIVDENGVYCGGAIFPGRLLLRKSLNLFTAQLPVFPLYDDLPEFPGKSSISDLRWGTDAMLIAGITQIIEKTKALFPGKTLRIVACGGDADFLMRHIPGLEYGGADFTKEGIKALYKKAME
ncbi:MAG: type III pantothenate kinase [Lentisphaeria bacterium]|nr:type III pantothenate kinase [Lentisphaeria bacterium]